VRPVASLSLDLDNQWSYMKTHGDPGWVELPSYLDLVVPRFLEVLARHGLTITVVVVGQDAAEPSNHEALRAIRDAGHEIANHSFRHEPWLDRYSAQEVDEELSRAEDAIEGATGVRPTGFRGPGYSLSETVLAALVRRGYRYDASTLPTFIGPLARAYYFRAARLTPAQREERANLFGSWRDGLRPVKPYRWAVGSGSLLEIPVTTFPWIRTPIHPSYVAYVAGFSDAAARGYVRTALRACRAAGVGPSILLHPLDFLGAEDVAGLGFFPGMETPRQVKLDLVDRYLATLCEEASVVPLAGHAEHLESGPLPRRRPEPALR
jgi:peptidoglycan/xylan/chitin deacetylase (PgdA/CDA1 family)